MKNKIKKFLAKHQLLVIMVCLFFVVIINFICLLVEVGIEFSDFDIKKVTSTDKETVWEILKEFGIVAIVSSLNFLIPILILFAVYISKRMYNRSKLSEEDFKKYKEYYRDVLYGYSPGVLSYIDNFELEEESIISSVLLSLKLKKKIELSEENSQICVNDNLDDLDESDKYVVSKIQNGKLNDFNKYEYSSLVQSQAQKAGLIEKSKLNLAELFKTIIIFLVIIVLLIAIGITLFNNIVNNPVQHEIEVIFLMFIILFVVFFPVFTIIYSVRYIAKSASNPYIRTASGEDMNRKLEGLKNYLKDFSSLDEKSINDIMLWDEYLIYSVMFAQNKNITKKILGKYTNYYS